MLEDEDEQWILEFNEDERKYGKFYKEPTTFVSLQMIYVNSKKEIERITQVRQQLDKENVLLASTLNKLIYERNYVSQTHFRLYKLLLYNISVEPEEVINNSTKNIHEIKNIHELMDIREIKDVIFEDTINYLKTANTLFFIFVEDTTMVLNQHHQPDATTFSLNRGSRRHKRYL